MTRETSMALRVGVPITAGLVLLAAAWLARKPEPPKPVQPPIIVCAEAPAAPDVDPVDVPAPAGWVEPVAKPVPGPDIYALLEKCLQDTKRQEYLWGAGFHVTVADVRRYVEVEHDPVWLENRAWWLPLSGEGEQNYPSGLYISVPLDGTTCGGAIVN